MLTTAQKNKIEEIRRSVEAMITLRTKNPDNDVFQPSEIWRLINNYLAYIRTLSAEHLENIRCHIGMGYFLGPAWDKEFYDGFRVKNDAAAAALSMVQKYIQYTSGLPECFWASEPFTNEATEAIGVKYKNRLINADIVKEQATIRNLYNLGLIGAAGKDNLTVLEIGPGYGPLMFQLSRMLGETSCFVCVDYPETLFWSAIYLAVNSDPDKIYIWQPENSVPLSELSKCYRFIMLPNFALSALGNERIFDLAINKNSFQEMSEAQVTCYAETVSELLKGWLYSYNAARQFMNNQLQSPVQDILSRYFTGGPTDKEYRKAGIEFRDQDAKRIFVGYSKTGAPQTRKHQEDTIWLSDKAVKVA